MLSYVNSVTSYPFVPFKKREKADLNFGNAAADQKSVLVKDLVPTIEALKSYKAQLNIVDFNKSAANNDVAGSLQQGVATLGNEAVKLYKSARIDNLTGLYNRNHFDNVFEKQFNAAKKAKTPLCAVFCDLDNFKAINDVLKHKTGDAVLKKVGKTIKDELEKTKGHAFRYGGEEVVILLPMTQEKAIPVAEKIREAIAENLKPVYIEFLAECKKEIKIMGKREEDKVRKKERQCWYEQIFKRRSITASMGLAEIRQNDTTHDEFLNRADSLLKMVKGDGKNAVGVAHSDSMAPGGQTFEIIGRAKGIVEKRECK